MPNRGAQSLKISRAEDFINTSTLFIEVTPNSPFCTNVKTRSPDCLRKLSRSYAAGNNDRTRAFPGGLARKVSFYGNVSLHFLMMETRDAFLDLAAGSHNSTQIGPRFLACLGGIERNAKLDQEVARGLLVTS
jgi:hypothetical protein